MFLVNKPKLVSVALTVGALAPFIISLIIGIQPGFVLPGSDYNNLVNLVTNILSLLITVSCLNIVAKSPEMCAFISENKVIYHRVFIVFPGFSLINIATFMLAQKHALFAQTYRFFWLVEPVNEVWLFVNLYLLQVVLFFLLLFLNMNGSSISVRKYFLHLLLVSELFFIYCLSLGVFSRPGDIGFGTFITLCPLAVVISAFVFDLSETQIKLFGLSQTPVLARLLFCMVHMLFYSIIISVKYQQSHLFLSLGAFVIFSLMVSAVIVVRFKKYLLRRSLTRKITAMNQAIDSAPNPTGKTPLSSTWYNDKVRSYHELREL
jgi:hypothetical protein